MTATSPVTFLLIPVLTLLLGIVTPATHAFSSVTPLTTRPATITTTTTTTSIFASDAARYKRVANLQDWATNEAGIKVGGLIIQQSVGGGLGLQATQSVPANSVLISVPSSLALSVDGDGPDDRLFVEQAVTDFKTLRDHTPWFVQFSMYLQALDKISSIKGSSAAGDAADGINMQPWLDSLPRSFDTPLHWSTTDDLQYSHLADSVIRQESEWKILYEQMERIATPALKLTWKDFVWGCECARSRAFSGAYTGSAFNPAIYAFTLLLVTIYVSLGFGTLEQAANGAGVVVCASIFKDFVLPKLFAKSSDNKKFVICPLIDMANHQSMQTSGDVSFEFFGDSYSLASCSVLTGDISSGDEFFISYGARSNDQLLQYYGFVEVDNPHDVYVMPPLREWDIAALERACGRTFASGRLQKLQRAGLLGSASDTTDNKSTTLEDTYGVANPKGGVVVTRVAGIDPAVVQALRALVSNEEEWDAAGEAIGNFATKMSAANEAAALTCAKTALEMELAAKATTLEQDVQLHQRSKVSKSSDLSAEEKLALEFRIEKKKLLQETIDNL